MTLNPRERVLALSVGTLAALLGVFYLAIKPFFERGAQISRDLDQAKVDRRDAETLVTRRQQLILAWNKMKSTGVLKDDPNEAGQQVINVLQSWAQESGVTLNALQAEPPAAVSGESGKDKPEAKFKRVNIHATALGPMRTLSTFLWRVESSPLVLKVVEVQITSKKEASDDLQLQLNVATLSPVTDAGKDGKPGGQQPARVGPVASAAP